MGAMISPNQSELRTEWVAPGRGSTVRELLTELLVVGHPFSSLQLQPGAAEKRTALLFLGPGPLQPYDVKRSLQALADVLPAGSLESALAPTAVKPAPPPAAEPSPAAGALPLGHEFEGCPRYLVCGQHNHYGCYPHCGACGGPLAAHLPPTEQAGIGGAAASPGVVPPAPALEAPESKTSDQNLRPLLAPSGEPQAPGGAFGGDGFRLRGADIVGGDKLPGGAALLRMRWGTTIHVDAEALRKLAALEFVSAVGL